MFCTKCGKEIPDDSRFCRYCGHKVNVIADDSGNSTNKMEVPGQPVQNSASKPMVAKSGGIDLAKLGKTVKRKLVIASAQVGAVAEAKVKAAVENSRPMDNESDNNKKAAFKKKSLKDKTKSIKVLIVSIAIVLVLVSVIGAVAGQKNDSPSESESMSAISMEPIESEDDVSSSRHAVHLFVEFESNWFFDKYDVEVSVDDQVLGTLPHGEDGSYDIELVDGKHTFSVKDVEGIGRIGSEAFDATGLSSVGFNIDIGNDQIYIERLDTATAPFGSDEAVGKTRQEVEDAFRNSGFNNITVNELCDLPLDQTGSADTVESVTVGGSEPFTSDDTLFLNDEIVISVHTPAKIKAPVSSTALLGMNYEEARAQLEGAGFTVECTPSSFYDSSYGDWEVKEVDVDELFAPRDFEAGSEFDYGTTIKLYYNEQQAEREPSEWDKEWAARQDFEAYGEILYPYGFKCHWLLDLVICEPQGDGTYFIKVGVTVTNEYGAERDTYAQGIAGNGSVRDFWVS